ncbi:class I SAM-dependent methyltransferase [Longispora albida]|uniref:class I SAM-dependent methyltransferase n=1 Tax=Longispora albida TaxID=203523 RepID=UPI00037638E9|nr:class I SAM-dependent methyltransferase [Longispora albida]
MDAFDFSRKALSFGPAADLYDRIRPSYPAEAATWLLGRSPLRVADLGAGTGIFSRLLARLGHEVIAVEPDPAMRALIGPSVTALAGTAEAIPLPDASVDAVVAAQAYHWFDPGRAHHEAARVLKDGGIFGPVWNLRDESVDWVREISKIAESEAQSVLHEVPGDFGPAFGQTERTTYRHVTAHTADTLISLVRSRSYYLTATAERQAEVEDELRALVAPMPQPFELPYVTVAMRARRLPRG